MESEQEKPKNATTRTKLLAVVFLILLALGIFGAIPRIANKKEIDALAAQHDLPKVSVTSIKPNEKPIELVLPSSAQAWHITPIWSRVDGYLIRYLVDIGDVVKEGELLAEIDTPETDQQVAQAKADLENSIAVRDIAKITSERWDNLWKKNNQAVSKQEVDQYQANLLAAEATVVANEKNVAKYTYQQGFKKIYAPFDGVITQRKIDIGSLIYGTVNSNAQELFQLAQTHVVRFFVDVPQNYFRQIKDGVEAEVTLQEFPGKIFKGVVTRYAKALDPVARTLLTEVDVKNPDGMIYPGLFANVKFMLAHENVSFIVPTTSVIIRAGFPHIAVVNNENVVNLKKVRIGKDYGKTMEIVYGLEDGDRIIRIPSDKIAEGIHVDVNIE